MATQQLCVVVPELAILIFFYIVCLHCTRRAKELENETAESRLSATADVTFNFPHLHAPSQPTMNFTSGLQETLSLKHVSYTAQLRWPANEPHHRCR